jgi:hypothetical protein
VATRGDGSKPAFVRGEPNTIAAGGDKRPSSLVAFSVSRPLGPENLLGTSAVVRFDDQVDAAREPQARILPTGIVRDDEGVDAICGESAPSRLRLRTASIAFDDERAFH